MMYANDARARQKLTFCCREHRSEYERKHGRDKLPSKPVAKIENLWEYGGRLQDWKRANNMTTNSLAALAGVSCGSIHRVERGECGLSQAVYERIGNFTGVW